MAMTHAYAQALWKAVENGSKPKDAVIALRALLLRDGRISLLSRVAHAFRKIAERYEQKNDIVISVAKESDIKSALKEAAEHLGSVSIVAREAKTRVEPELIGGWRLEGKETLVDASYKKFLLDMYNRITRS